ncbi:MAG: hypothetical protein PHT07_20800 [Paludibacter sp.]|nr:hypothetical protein [Paludibacter sp.]
MNEVIELAKRCGLINEYGRANLTLDHCFYTEDFQAFYEAAKAQGVKEFREALGETVAYVKYKDGMVQNYSLYQGTGLVGEFKLYALPNTKDEVK